MNVFAEDCLHCVVEGVVNEYELMEPSSVTESTLASCDPDSLAVGKWIWPPISLVFAPFRTWELFPLTSVVNPFLELDLAAGGSKFACLSQKVEWRFTPRAVAPQRVVRVRLHLADKRTNTTDIVF